MKENLQEKYFYALNEAELYDATIKLTVPYYDLLHETILDVLNYHFEIKSIRDKNKIKGLFLDVGAGTGKESLLVLNSFSRLNCLAVDLAPEMKEAFNFNSNKVLGKKGSERVSYIVEDFFNVNLRKVENLNSNFKNLNHIAAISAYCIHHFTLAEKKVLYKKMYDFLDTGGILINVDLFNYNSKRLSQFAHNFDIEFIKREFDNPSPEFIESQNLPKETRKKLKKQWVLHMENDNKLHTIDEQIKILKEIGFREAECVFRYIQQGILVAVK